MIKERISLSGDLKNKVKQLMIYAGWYKGCLLYTSISPHRPMMRLPLSASPPGTPPRSVMLKFWTICARCWSRRNFPAVTRWSSVGRKNSICPFPACRRRESISSLPALCSTPICTRLWSDTLAWLCGSLSGIKTSRMKPVRCPAPLPCLLWGWRDHSGVRWCAIIWIYVMMNIPLYRRSSSTHFLKNADLPFRHSLY